MHQGVDVVHQNYPLIRFKKVNPTKFLVFPLSMKHCKYYYTFNIAHSF